MNHVPIEELLPRAGGSVYRLTRLASKRATQIADGKPALIPNAGIDKPTTTALLEIASGKLEAVSTSKK